MARRDAGLQVSDRITLSVAGPPDVLAAVGAHRSDVAAQTLAVSMSLADAPELEIAVSIAVGDAGRA